MYVGNLSVSVGVYGSIDVFCHFRRRFFSCFVLFHFSLLSFPAFSCVFRKKEIWGGIDLQRTRADQVCLTKSSECFRSVVSRYHETIRDRLSSTVSFPQRKDEREGHGLHRPNSGHWEELPLFPMGLFSRLPRTMSGECFRSIVSVYYLFFVHGSHAF